jgi:hypothetical protein
MGGINGLQDITQHTNIYQTKPFSTALVLDQPTSLKVYQKHATSITPASQHQFGFVN